MSTPSCLDQWRNAVAEMRAPQVIELGTKGWDGRPPRHHKDEILALNPAATWIGVDAEDGEGVDVVADVHQIDAHFPPGAFDAVFAASVLEHFRRPWIAAVKLAKIVRRGGLIFVQSHQSFPLHGYPKDYFRFTQEALRELFAEDAGWRVIDCEYKFPAKVIPLFNEVTSGSWNFEAEAWLNTEMIAERI